MSDPTLSRRQLLAAAAGGAAALALPGRALAQGSGPGLTPEIVTVTDTSLVAWWPTATPSDTTIRIQALDGPTAGRVRRRRLERDVTMHVAKVDGLRPGTRYRYELLSGGVRQSAPLNSEADPGVVTTLVRPRGRRLARIAVMNDLHVGEHCSGTIATLPDGTSYPPCNSAVDYPDYAYRMDAAAIAELRHHRVDLLIVNGDLTDRGREDDIRRCLALVRSLGVPLLITRGNHDRRLAGACAPDGDCLRAQAFPRQAVGDGPVKSVRRVGRRLAVVGLDSADPDTGRGRLDLDSQPTWLDKRLTQLEAEGRDIIVAFHHPIIPVTQPPGISDKVDLAKGGNEVLDVLARHPHVRLVLGGHTHRNNLGQDATRGGAIPFLENGAIKEYPAGYALLDVHEHGIMRTFHRPVNDWTRLWTKVSAGQVFGNHAGLTRGSLASRAFVLGYRSNGSAIVATGSPRV
jgi:predicted phosphodiesterase